MVKQQRDQYAQYNLTGHSNQHIAERIQYAALENRISKCIRIVLQPNVDALRLRWVSM